MTDGLWGNWCCPHGFPTSHFNSTLENRAKGLLAVWHHSCKAEWWHYLRAWGGNSSSINIIPGFVSEHQQEWCSNIPYLNITRRNPRQQIERFGCQGCVSGHSGRWTGVAIRNLLMEIRIFWMTDLCQNVCVKLVQKSRLKSKPYS